MALGKELQEFVAGFKAGGDFVDKSREGKRKDAEQKWKEKYYDRSQTETERYHRSSEERSDRQLTEAERAHREAEAQRLGYDSVEEMEAHEATLGGGGKFDDQDMEAAAKGIRTIESGSAKGNYGALGKTTRTGDRAYGAYQVMGANIPSWTKKHFGKELSPDEFLKNPEAQDAVFKGEFGNYLGKFGPAGAARAWFGGPGAANKRSTYDPVSKRSTGDYGDQFTSLFRGFGGGRKRDPEVAEGIPQPPSRPKVQETGSAGDKPYSDRVASVIPGPGEAQVAELEPEEDEEAWRPTVFAAEGGVLPDPELQNSMGRLSGSDAKPATNPAMTKMAADYGAQKNASMAGKMGGLGTGMMGGLMGGRGAPAQWGQGAAGVGGAPPQWGGMQPGMRSPNAPPGGGLAAAYGQGEPPPGTTPASYARQMQLAQQAGQLAPGGAQMGIAGQGMVGDPNDPRVVAARAAMAQGQAAVAAKEGQNAQYAAQVDALRKQLANPQGVAAAPGAAPSIGPGAEAGVLPPPPPPPAAAPITPPVMQVRPPSITPTGATPSGFVPRKVGQAPTDSTMATEDWSTDMSKRTPFQQKQHDKRVKAHEKAVADKKKRDAAKLAAEKAAKKAAAKAGAAAPVAPKAAPQYVMEGGANQGWTDPRLMNQARAEGGTVLPVPAYSQGGAVLGYAAGGDVRYESREDEEEALARERMLAEGSAEEYGPPQELAAPPRQTLPTAPPPRAAGGQMDATPVPFSEDEVPDPKEMEAARARLAERQERYAKLPTRETPEAPGTLGGKPSEEDIAKRREAARPAEPEVMGPPIPPEHAEATTREAPVGAGTLGRPPSPDDVTQRRTAAAAAGVTPATPQDEYPPMPAPAPVARVIPELGEGEPESALTAGARLVAERYREGIKKTEEAPPSNIVADWVDKVQQNVAAQPQGRSNLTQDPNAMTPAFETGNAPGAAPESRLTEDPNAMTPVFRGEPPEVRVAKTETPGKGDRLPVVKQGKDGKPVSEPTTTASTGKREDIPEMKNNPKVISAGLTSIQKNLEKPAEGDGPVPTPQGKDFKLRRFASNADAPDQKTMNQLFERIDPEGKLDNEQRMLKSMHDQYDFWMSRGKPDRAAAAVGSLLAYSKQSAQKFGSMAQVAVEKGDYVKAGQILSKGYAVIPDGKSLEISALNKEGKADKDGNVLAYRIVDRQTGKVLQEGMAKPQDISALSKGMQDGSGWLQQTFDATKEAAEAMPYGGRGRGRAGERGPTTYEQRQEEERRQVGARQEAIDALKAVREAETPEEKAEAQERADDAVRRYREYGGGDTDQTRRGIGGIYKDAGVELPPSLQPKEERKPSSAAERAEEAETKTLTDYQTKRANTSEGSPERRTLDYATAGKIYEHQKDRTPTERRDDDPDSVVDAKEDLDDKQKRAYTSIMKRLLLKNSVTADDAAEFIDSIRRDGNYDFNEKGKAVVPGLGSDFFVNPGIFADLKKLPRLAR